MIAGHIESQPARWDNLGDPRPDSMIVRTARFRGVGDSLDVFIAALPPTDAIRASSPAHTVRGDVWIMAGNGRMAFHTANILESPGVHAWAGRVPSGSYLWRVEATGAEAKRAARASGQVQSLTDFPIKGPGMSDILVASSASDATKPGARWRDLGIVPNVGSVAKGTSVALVWENYELGSRSGSAQYDVVVSIIQQKTTTGKIVAAITGALASVAKVETRPDRAVIQYERTGTAVPAIAEMMTIDLGETPAGTYAITVDVTDKVSGAKFSRSTTVLIRG